MYTPTSSMVATSDWPDCSVHCCGDKGVVVPDTCGKGHSRGYAWCIHCENNRPCRGTSPPFCCAISSKRPRKVDERLRGASTVSDGKAEITSAMRPGEALSGKVFQVLHRYYQCQ